MLEGFKNFFADPLRRGDDRASALDYFLFVGFILVCLAGWRIIISHIQAD